MTAWKRAAFGGLIAGVTVAALLLLLIWLFTPRFPRLWWALTGISMVLFPTHIFLLPLSESVSFPHDVIFYGVAILGNGVVYSVGAQVVIGGYVAAKWVLENVVRGRI